MLRLLFVESHGMTDYKTLGDWYTRVLPETFAALEEATSKNDDAAIGEALAGCPSIKALRRGQLSARMPTATERANVYATMLNAMAADKTSVAVWSVPADEVRLAHNGTETAVAELRPFTKSYWISKFVVDANECRARLQADLLEGAQPKGAGFVFGKGTYSISDYQYTLVASWGHIDVSLKNTVSHGVDEQREKR